MPQELRLLRPGAYQMQGSTNQGLIVQDGQGVLIDAGLDKSTAKDILKVIEALQIDLRALIITHGHTDHFGGATTILQHQKVAVYAPALERAIVENPMLEPYYLFSGATPIEELTQKFILARQPCPVHYTLEAGQLEIAGLKLEAIHLPGHAPNQMGIIWRDVCFTADGFFHPETIDKYGIPFYVNVDGALQTLTKLAQMDFAYWVPGHGEALTNAKHLLAQNRVHLEMLRDCCEEALREPRPTEEVLAYVLSRVDKAVSNAAIYYLCRTTVHACLASLRAHSRIELTFDQNRALWRRV